MFGAGHVSGNESRETEFFIHSARACASGRGCCLALYLLKCVLLDNESLFMIDKRLRNVGSHSLNIPLKGHGVFSLRLFSFMKKYLWR